MRKILIIFVFVCLLFVTSCTKNNRFNDIDYGKINYYYCGLYLEVGDLGSRSIKDDNPKVYFCFENTSEYGFLQLISGYDTNAINFGDSSRYITVKDDYTLYISQVNLSMVNSNNKSFVLYPITLTIDKKGNATYEVVTKVSQQIDLTKDTSFKYNVSYNYKGDSKMGIEIKLLFN